MHAQRAWHGSCDPGRIVSGFSHLMLGVVGFCAGFLLFLALSTAVGSDVGSVPARRCDPSAWPAPSGAPPALAPGDGTRPVAA